ncbi:unnamed protein product, partial [Arabidopsis halleri]
MAAAIPARDPYDNPYYLTNNDHSGLLLVSDRLTGAGNFGSWQQSMIMALNGRNKLCFCAGCVCDLDRKWMDLFERNFVIKFLFGLNDSYEHIRESIVMMDPLPDLEKSLHMVIQHEHQQEMKQTSQSGSVVFQMSSSNIQSPSYESVIGAVSGGYKPRQRPVCTYCGLQGHLVTRCYKLHGYPPGYKPPSQS